MNFIQLPSSQLKLFSLFLFYVVYMKDGGDTSAKDKLTFSGLLTSELARSNLTR